MSPRAILSKEENMRKADSYHIPVMLMESVDALNIKPDGVYVDVTFGGGGHSKEILKRLDNGKLIAFDQDPSALQNKLHDPRFVLVEANFRNMRNWLQVHGVAKVNGILADLGVSSHQFDTASRGFTLRADGPLDMRMNHKIGDTAAELIAKCSVEDLAKILGEYGEVIRPSQVARRILSAPEMQSTSDLVKSVEQILPRGKEHKVLAQIFQALRIAVNKELESLAALLAQSTQCLAPEGRLVIISYHSLEDKMVKNFLRSGNVNDELNKDFFGNLIRPFDPLPGKPVVPSLKETNQNNRARSAKLRVGIRNTNA
jgi:16S rRNA (cytosine1402-N4)-methyltransferase